MQSPEYELFKSKGGDMAKAAERLWILSQDEALKEYAMIEDRKKKDLKAIKETVYEEGMEKGMEKGHREVALNMLKMGVDLQVILDSTKLSEQEVEELKKQIK